MYKFAPSLPSNYLIYTMGFLRTCWIILPIFFAAASLTFSLLVLISGTSAKNGLSDIYFLKVYSSFAIYFLIEDKHYEYYSKFCPGIGTIQVSRTITWPT